MAKKERLKQNKTGHYWLEKATIDTDCYIAHELMKARVEIIKQLSVRSNNHWIFKEKENLSKLP